MTAPSPHDEAIECIGYVVIEFNQASHQPEKTTDEYIYTRREEADNEAAYQRERTRVRGRRDSFAVGAVWLLEDPS